MDDKKMNYTKVALSSTKEYPTYQAIYELHPQNSLDASGLFRKSVLIVVDWLRGRVAESSGDTSFLSDYSNPSEYGAFQVETAANITPHSGYDASSLYSKKEKSWALRVIENNLEKDFYQSFKTDIAIKELENSVLLAIRITCREEEREELADVWRTSFVAHVLMDDEDIIITEKDCPIEFPIILGAISLNGKSKQICEMFNNGFVENDNRKFPIVIMPEAIFSRIDQDELFKKMVDKIKGISYITMLEESVNKLFITTMNKPELAKELEKGDKCLVITDPKDEEGFKTHVLFNGIRDSSGNERIDEPELDSVCKYVQNYLRKKDVDYGDLMFLFELRQVVLLENMPSGASETEKQEIVGMFEKTLEEKDEELRRMTDEVANRDKRIKKLEKDLKEAHHENKSDSLAMELDEVKAKSKELMEEIEAKDDELKEVRTQLHNSKERFKPIAKIPLPPNYNKETFIQWIRDNYSDAIIVHDRAEKELLRDNTFNEFGTLARMIHYLYGFTVYTNENPGDYNKAIESAKAYDILDENWEASNSGDAYIHNKEAYSLNISQYDPEEGEVILNKHVRSGVNPQHLVRVYYYYDSRIGKSIIGSMPEHLPTDYK